MRKRQSSSCILAEQHYGEFDAPTLLLLHGFGANSAWWSRSIAYLTHHYQIYTLDLEFHALDLMAGEVLDWMRQKHLLHCSIIGHSLGALLAMYIVAAAPPLVDHLILTNPSVVIPERSLWKWLWKCYQARKISREPPKNSFHWFHMRPQTCRVVLQALRQQPMFDIATPTMTIWGNRDPLFPLSYAPTFLQMFQSARFLSVEGGHSVMYERPELFSQGVLHFLTGSVSR
jgi:pimeloyl-ACP methyl ester carboxylesterase